MEKEPRKASEVLLELESKLDAALSIIRTQDLTIKIIANKLNFVLESLEKLNSPKIVVEAINTTARPLPTPVTAPLSEREIPVSSETNLPMEDSPKGFRRTSRPETFSGDDSYLSTTTTKYPTQIPKMPMSGINTPPPGRSLGETVVPDKVIKKMDTSAVPIGPQPVIPHNSGNAIPVSQRVVSAHGKSLFLADVEIVDLSNMQTVSKTRTNGTGKWSASLGVGAYRVFIRKLDSVTKERLEVKQEITVDGQQSPLELQAIIVKS